MKPKTSVVQQFVSLAGVGQALGVSERTVHELRRQPWFPPAVELGPRALRWHLPTVLEAVAQRAPRTKLRSEPAQLLRSRIERLKAGV